MTTTVLGVLAGQTAYFTGDYGCTLGEQPKATTAALPGTNDEWRRTQAAQKNPYLTAATPTMYVAVSTSADPASTWHRYTLTFSGGLFPAGTLLDYPMVGQDRNAILIGSNNYQLTAGGWNYLNSTIFAIPKSAAYGGLGFSFPAFATAFSTYPAIPKGNPMAAYGTSYALAANEYCAWFATVELTDRAPNGSTRHTP